MAVQWIPFVFGLFAGGVVALVLKVALVEFARRNQMARFTYNRETDELKLDWVNIPNAKKPVQRINGKDAIPLLRKEQKKVLNGRPCFFIDAESGEAFNIDPADIQHAWPNARDRLRQWKSLREKKIANAADPNDGMDLLKLGAIGGMIAGAASLLVLVLMWQTFGGL